MRSICIIRLENGTNVGDNAAAEEIHNKLKQLYKNTKVTNIVFDAGTKEKPTDAKTFFKNIKIDSNTKYVVISGGCIPIHALIEAKKIIGNKSLTLLAAHQSSSELGEAQEYIDKIALPIVDKFKPKDKSKLISTLGVASLMTKQDIVDAYKIKKENIISSDNGYIMAVMGGDATNPEKKVQHYTHKEATKLADHLTEAFSKANGRKLLITNGPRTGKHTPETEEITENHKGDTSLDHCSQALLDRLKENGLCDGVDFQFSDFRFLEKGVDSAYQSFLGAAASSSESEVLIAGESTSMLSDCNQIGILPTAFNNAAMNPNHTNFATMLNNNRMITYLDKDFQPISKTDEFKIKDFDTNLTVGEQIAQSIFKEIESSITIEIQPSTPKF